LPSLLGGVARQLSVTADDEAQPDHVGIVEPDDLSECRRVADRYPVEQR
jgi:hypothetical protein